MSEQTNERSGARKQSKQCARSSKRTCEWLSTYVWILDCSQPLCSGGDRHGGHCDGGRNVRGTIGVGDGGGFGRDGGSDGGSLSGSNSVIVATMVVQVVEMVVVVIVVVVELHGKYRGSGRGRMDVGAGLIKGRN